MKEIKINPHDNVAVIINAENGTVPTGHKVALCDIKTGDTVIKYGYPIGVATTDIKSGEHVHSHNMRSSIGGVQSYKYEPTKSTITPGKSGTFMGYKRPDGRVGVRNEVWVVTTVGCVAPTAREIERRTQKYKTKNIDGIYSFTHPYGCSQLGDDMSMTLKFLCGLINNPNAAAVLVLGLGCENGNIEELKAVLGPYDTNRVKFLNSQDVEDELAEGEKIVKALAEYADGVPRTECSVKDLVIGLKCGGSDGFSGITANALLGSLTDKIVAEGGSTILTEVPEMFGAEQILMNRAVSEKVFQKTADLINDFKKYFMRYGERVDENPSPGNKEGGITTLAEKSLGCVQKGGTAPVIDVLSYSDNVRERGLSLLNAPGNDLVASCALVASGAQIVLFTTGRGTPFCCPVPTVKISSNTALYERKKAWLDFDAGVLLDGTPINALTDDFYDYIIKLASGELRAKSETLDKSSLAIWKDGVTL